MKPIITTAVVLAAVGLTASIANAAPRHHREREPDRRHCGASAGVSVRYDGDHASVRLRIGTREHHRRPAVVVHRHPRPIARRVVVVPRHRPAPRPIIVHRPRPRVIVVRPAPRPVVRQAYRRGYGEGYRQGYDAGYEQATRDYRPARMTCR